MQKYQTIQINDVHLGTPRLNRDLFVPFLEELIANPPKLLIMAGDIVDVTYMWKNGGMSSIKKDLVMQLLEHLTKLTRVIYILGNHEANHVGYLQDLLPKAAILKTGYVDLDTKTYHTHGHLYSRYSSGSWKQLFKNWGYDLITPIDRALKPFGINIIASLKSRRPAQNYIQEYQEDLLKVLTKEECLKHSLHTIACGHIHDPKVLKSGYRTYVNGGDWVDSCTYAAHDGKEWTVYKYQEE